MAEYTRLRNKNRGYMKLEVWQKSMDLYKMVWQALKEGRNVDYKLRSQILDSAQSVSSNTAEGYSHRSIKEYIQFLYIALGSLSETITRIIGLKVSGFITPERSGILDELYYEVENKLLRLIESLEKKRDEGSWVNRISDNVEEYHP